MNPSSCLWCETTLPRLHGRGRPRIWCSQACRVAKMRADGGGFNAKDAPPRPCQNCQAQFAPTRHDARFCSRECGWRYRSTELRAHARVCVVCGTAFTSLSAGSQGRFTCSAACQKVSFARSCKATVRTCQDCGMGTTRHPTGTGPLCLPCAETRRRVHNRHKNTQRRTVPRPRRSISLRQLGDRDGWRCHLCHKKVDSKLKFPNLMCPTLDHLIPVAGGGSDEPENLRLAHLTCNSRRGDRGTVQLLLFG